MEDLEKNNDGGFQSYEEVDPKKQLNAVELRLKEIDDMFELDEDTKEERKKLEALRENLMSNGDPRAY